MVGWIIKVHMRWGRGRAAEPHSGEKGSSQSGIWARMARSGWSYSCNDRYTLVFFCSIGRLIVLCVVGISC